MAQFDGKLRIWTFAYIKVFFPQSKLLQSVRLQSGTLQWYIVQSVKPSILMAYILSAVWESKV
jgi:hypothetical protein